MTEKIKQSLIAGFLLASLEHRNIRWPELPCTERTRADAGVCAFLGMVDPSFNTETKVEILADSTRLIQWQDEMKRINAILDQQMGNGPVNTHPIGSMGAPSNPTISTTQPLTNAAGIMVPGAADLAQGTNLTGKTPDTTRKPSHPARRTTPATNDTAIYIADTHGSTSLAPSPLSHAAKTPLTTNTNTAAASSIAAATTTVAPTPSTPDNKTTPIGPSSSTAAEPGAGNQTTDGQRSGRVSKAKKKREGRKRAKAARAAVDAGQAAGDDGDGDEDGEGEVRGIADV